LLPKSAGGKTRFGSTGRLRVILRIFRDPIAAGRMGVNTALTPI